MHVLIEYNSNLDETLEFVKKLNLTPVILFKITLNTKDKIKENLSKIKELKNKYSKYSSAIQITLQKQDNFTGSIINNLISEFDITIGLGGLNKTNRYFLEHTNIDFLQDSQNSQFKSKIDFIHHFNSGLNHILCKFAKQKNINFLFSLNFTNTTNKYNLAKELGRINQNIIFARKYDIPILLNFIIKNKYQIKTKKQLEYISTLFNISILQKQENINLLRKVIENNKLKNSKNYINKYIQIV